MRQRILGIDPGLNITGYGVIDIAPTGVSIVEAGVVRGKTRGDVPARVLEIHEGITDVITSLKPTVMAMEELYSHYDRPKTAIIMGHARGVLCLAAAQNELPLKHYSATQIKKILTGSGRAPKNQMQDSIRRELGLSEVPEPADVADALAVALCHHYLSKVASAF
ncbi:crossover junction endodeoxyribonuclease RuvC [Bremerella cremea]|uniref:Crossover junction endodeoxyribonuclease RuvC n=1 Tax=Blastopirellula marina TaxID=124 RepID=A0A2S8FRV3_9BACT|nr:MULTISPECIES: crossover junction endodeoxyribonuclease RuvC [Pirellulaceae]PQO34790.1 crossover junction endodeoxyribonuclease RuvC [Blastopirellula marina]RCS47289.1 crossover junction endodeoxyribonuclease RuvC [Bremerella cremea]